MGTEALLARAAEIAAEIAELQELDELDDDQAARFDAIVIEGDEIADQLDVLEERAAKIARIEEAAKTKKNIERGTRAPHVPGVMDDDPYAEEMRASVWDTAGQKAEMSARAKSAIEGAMAEERLNSTKADQLSRVLRKFDDKQGTIARRLLATGSVHYRSAFSKYVANPMAWQSMVTPDEARAVARAMSLTDGAGGFAVPFTLDGTLITLGDVETNPFRRISRVVPITTDAWNGLASDALDASWDGEAVEVSDDTTTFTQPTVPVHKAAAFVAASLEIQGDYPGLEGDLGTLFGDAKSNLEATAHALGTGSGQPTGIVTALDGTASDTSSATTDVFAAEDVYATDGALQEKHRGSATWVSNRTIQHDIRQFGTTDPNFTVDFTAAGVPQLLGRPIEESSAMDGVVNAAAENNILVYGNFQNYLIADRVGAQLEFIPHLFATANNLPSGQRGWYYWWRTGADSINDGAFILLNVT